MNIKQLYDAEAPRIGGNGQMAIRPKRRKKHKGGGFSWSSYWATRKPSALTLTVLSDTSIKLDWTANGVEDYDGYSVERSADGVTYVEVDTVAVGTETFTDTGLTEGTLYYYRVRAYKDAEYSDYTFEMWTAPLVVTDMVQFFDGTIVGNELIDKSPLELNAAITANKINNSSCEHDWGYTSFNPNSVVAQSNTQAHGGTYSFKATVTGGGNSGVATTGVTTITGHSYIIGLWLFIESVTSTSLRLRYYNTAGTYIGSALANKALIGEWQYLTITVTETAGGVNGKILMYAQDQNAVFYIDDVTMIDNTTAETHIILQENAAIIDEDISLVFFTAAGFAKNVLVTGLSLNSNDQIFYGATNKIIIYNKQADALMIDSTLSYLGGTHAIDKYFTGERIIKATDPTKHFGFPVTVWIGERLYCFFRDGRSQSSCDGKLVSRYSDDYGLTWSADEEVYTGAEILIDHPEYLIEDPDYVVNIIDFRTELLSSGNIVVLGSAIVSKDTPPPPDTNIDTPIREASYPFCLNIPINAGALDLVNMEIAYLPRSHSVTYYGLGLVVHDDIIYATTQQGDIIRLHKSTDDGAIWTEVSSVFNFSTVTESSIVFVGEVLYCVCRLNSGSTAYVAKSLDYGETWIDETAIDVNLHGTHAITTRDGEVFVIGRYLGQRSISVIKLSDVAISENKVDIMPCYTADNGYGNISKHKGIYYYTYHNGPVKAAPNIYGLASTAACYKAIVGHRVEDF